MCSDCSVVLGSVVGIFYISGTIGQQNLLYMDKTNGSDESDAAAT